MSEEKANQLKLEKTREIILNKPSNSEPTPEVEIKQKPSLLLQNKNTAYNNKSSITLKYKNLGYVFFNSILKFLAKKVRAFKILCQV